MKRTTAELSAAVAAEIMRRPCSLMDLCIALGLRERSTDRPRKYIDAFRAAGLVYVHSWRRNQSELWAWQPSPHFLPDAPRPLNRAEREARDVDLARRTHRRTRQAKKLMPNPGTPNSVFALGAGA